MKFDIEQITNKKFFFVDSEKNLNTILVAKGYEVVDTSILTTDEIESEVKKLLKKKIPVINVSFKSKDSSKRINYNGLQLLRKICFEIECFSVMSSVEDKDSLEKRELGYLLDASDVMVIDYSKLFHHIKKLPLDESKKNNR